MRPMTAAASARSSSAGPERGADGHALDRQAQQHARPDRPAAITHTSVLMRLTGMPSSAARSADSADARTAMPTRV